jgi:transposase
MTATPTPLAPPSFECAVGIDIAKQKFDTALLQGTKGRHKVFPNDPEGFTAFLAWLSGLGVAPAKCHVCREATGTYGLALAEHLSDPGVPVSVVNPAKIKAFGKADRLRAKTDKIDAKLIARFAQEKHPPLWTPPPPAARDLLALLRRVEPLLEMRQRERNRRDTAPTTTASSVQTVLDALEAELAAVREEIRCRIDSDPDLRRRGDLLDSIPGLGEASVPHLLVLFSHDNAFAKQAAAFTGRAPRLSESGRQAARTRLSKVGDPLLRKALYLPAWVAWRYNPVIRAFCERLKANGKNGKAIVCAAMRKLIHIAFGVLRAC